MNQQKITTGIILTRTDYGEADRILTLLTPDYGKLHVLAKGVRKVKSKLAGGIELFSVSNITFVSGRGELGTLISTRLVKHYGHIVNSIERTMLGYELIKQLNRATEDNPEPEYFHLLQHAFESLNDAQITPLLIQTWFTAQLLRLAGHSPNLRTDTTGQKLQTDTSYDFSYDDMAFSPNSEGNFRTDNIKFLRLLFSSSLPAVLQKVTGSDTLTDHCAPLIAAQRQLYLR